jgi:hypothetical protein
MHQIDHNRSVVVVFECSRNYLLNMIEFELIGSCQTDQSCLSFIQNRFTNPRGSWLQLAYMEHRNSNIPPFLVRDSPTHYPLTWTQIFVESDTSIHMRYACNKWTVLSFFFHGHWPSGRPSHLGMLSTLWMAIKINWSSRCDYQGLSIVQALIITAWQPVLRAVRKSGSTLIQPIGCLSHVAWRYCNTVGMH